jgi:hypothetical protein
MLKEIFSPRIKVISIYQNSEKIFVCSKLNNQYFKIIQSKRDIEQWSNLIRSSFENKSEDIKKTFEKDIHEIKNGKLIPLGIFNNDNELLITISIRIQSVQEMYSKVVKEYQLKEEYKEEFNDFATALKNKYPYLFEMTRYSSRKDISLQKNQKFFLISFLRNITQRYTQKLQKEKEKKCSIFSITSRRDCIIYKKLFQSTIKKGEKTLEYFGENNLELYIQLYSNYDTPDNYYNAFNNINIDIEGKNPNEERDIKKAS